MPVTTPKQNKAPCNLLTFDELVVAIKAQELPIDYDLLKKAYEFSNNLHQGQTRHSGEPYIHHPLEVAKILAELKLDMASIITGILHDTVEDTAVSLTEIEDEFGEEIADLVDGVTKISKITFQTTEEKQAENFRKMLLAMARDLRVILVKLADRTHNMRTLTHMPEDKQRQIAQETLDIYAPLANRLGLQSLKRELEDLSLRFTKSEIYYRLVAQVSKKRKEREKHIEEIKQLVLQALHDHDYHKVEVIGRPKHFYSIHRKMETRNLEFEQVYDLMGFRILLDSVEACYGVLGLIHSLWTPVPGRIKDYIAIPKPNFYQSLHSTVIGPSGEHLEFQIRTTKMHETAERGIAAHWAYKEGKTNAPIKDRETFSWLNRLLDSNQNLDDPNEFLDSVKGDLFSEEVYVFTPKGEVREFPAGSCPLDFAYAIHTDIGHRCIGARVNNRMVPLKYLLKSGDTVEIITSSTQKPNKDWLKMVKTSRAKSKIRAFVKSEEFHRAVETGAVILEKEFRRAGLNYNKLFKQGRLKELAKSFSLRAVDDLLSAVGYGKVSARKAIGRLTKDETKDEPKEAKTALQKLFDKVRERDKSSHVIKVKGVDDLLVRFAHCCNPVPGDSVIGFITRGRGISVHKRNCTKIFDSDPHRLIEIEWDAGKKKDFVVKLRIVCVDRSGILANMSNVIKEEGVNITRAQIATTKDKKAICLFSLTIKDLSHLRSVISNLESVDGVISVERTQRR